MHAQSPAPATAAAAPPSAAAPLAPAERAYPHGDASGLGATVSTLLDAPAVSPAHWGVAVAAMDGTPLFGLNEAQMFRPASTAKLFTTAAAMALLGPRRRWTTALEGPLGSRGSKVIDGDLRLVGGGDPDISAVTLPYAAPHSGVADEARPDALAALKELADKLARDGVTRVRGDVVGDDALWAWQPYAQGWSAEDAVWGYGAPVSALTIADNEVKLTMGPANALGKAPVIALDQAVPFFRVKNEAATVPAGQSADLDVQRVEAHTLLVTGGIAMGADADVEHVALDDPALYAAMVMKQMLVQRGIRVDGVARSLHHQADALTGFRTQLKVPVRLPEHPLTAASSALLTGSESCSDACPERVEHQSPEMQQDVIFTLKTSQNLHAEMLLRALGKNYGSEGTFAQGARVVRQWLVNDGIDGNDFFFYDGSGLSAQDLVTPRAAVHLLTFASMQPWFAAWKAALPVGGVDGTIASRFKDAPLKGHVFAKTGTLGESRGLAGYVECASGNTVAFAIYADDHMPGSAADREAMDKVVAAIAAAF